MKTITLQVPSESAALKIIAFLEGVLEAAPAGAARGIAFGNIDNARMVLDQIKREAPKAPPARVDVSKALFADKKINRDADDPDVIWA